MSYVFTCAITLSAFSIELENVNFVCGHVVTLPSGYALIFLVPITSTADPYYHRILG
jgi:hypothetical protein